MSWGLAWILIVLSVLLNAFFAGCETGLTSARRARLRHRADKGSRAAGLASRMLHDREERIIAAVVGNNVAVVAGTAVATTAFVARYGGHGETIAAILMSALNIVFGEILPKSLYRSHPERLLAASAAPFWFLTRLLAPLQWFALMLSRLLLRLLGQATHAEVPALTRQRLLKIFKLSHERDRLDASSDRLITRFVSASRLPLREILRPLAEVSRLSVEDNVARARDIVRQTGHSRIPLEDASGDLVGLLLFRDLLHAGDGESVREYLRSLLYLPVDMGIDEAIAALTTKQLSLAAVVDDRGRAVGIVTLEDLLEPLVGDMVDEHDALESANS